MTEPTAHDEVSSSAATKAASAAPTGTAYGRKPATHNALLTEVGPGTPCGEFMRRYWLPVALSADVTERPRKVSPLGEELIIFRDKSGRPGLLYPRCMHRGTSLYYGKVEEQGIRCCYHGWLFDVQGHCLQQPCEPQGGLKREAARQPWYPVRERYGLVFAYMGPPDKMPLLPRIEELDTLADGEYLHAFCDSGTQYDPRVEYPNGLPYNWLQAWENVMDPYHVYILHAVFSEVQFHDLFRQMPKVEFERAGNGVIYHARREMDAGALIDRISYAFLPNMSSIPPINLAPGKARGVQWWMPTGDLEYILYNVQVTKSAELKRARVTLTADGKSWDQMSEQERQDHPADFEAQLGQGRMSLHSDEHLAQSDAGIVMLRRLLQQQIRVVQEGGNPVGVAFTEEAAKIDLLSGNFMTRENSGLATPGSPVPEG
jgi:phenylpropionate dioxygenase-like ring-hydroxylating dioxygenase large terminal subunit